MHRSIILLIILVAVISTKNSINAQEKTLQIAFYNVENLFDTIDDNKTDDSEFTPQSKSAWNSTKFNTKLTNIAHVISDLGKAENIDGPAVIGLCEVENHYVLEELCKQQAISGLKYRIVHSNSPDKRGIDVALLYREKHFSLDHYNTHQLFLVDPVSGERIYTRNQLVVSGKLHNETTTFIVNHWPSRSGGQVLSEPKRLAAAQLTSHIIDSLYSVDSLQNIIIMGDFNDDPVNMSLTEQLIMKSDIDSVNQKELYNEMFTLFQKGNGTLCYHDKWNLFDQIIVNGNLLKNSGKFNYRGAHIFSPDYLKQQEGRYKDYPYRTLAGTKYLGGYSDHFPVYINLGLK